MKYLRIIVGIAILLFILLLPKWVYLPALVLGLVFFPFYWEGVLLGFLIDVLYGNAHIGMSFVYPFGIGAALFLVGFAPLRKFLRLQNV